jgi:hypothetical protein
MKSLPILALLALVSLLPTAGRAEEAPSSLPPRLVADRQTPLQIGADGTFYQVRYDLAKGREYWSSPYPQHPNYGIRFVYLLDKQGQRRSQTLYVESASGRLQLASSYRPGDSQTRASR